MRWKEYIAELQQSGHTTEIWSIDADQFEQRLVPKLRGIDASSISGRRCLDRVREVLKQLSVDRLDRALQASIDGSKDGPFEWNDSASQ